MTNKQIKFDANFTAGGILYNEFIAISSMLESENFNELITTETENNNFIGIAVEASRKRIIAEIKRRYAKAPKKFWNHFKNWNEPEKRLGLYYLCLITYPLVFDVHHEVVIKGFKLGSNLSDYDVQMRFDELSSSNEDFSNWADITLYKLNTQIRKALKDAGLYDGTKLFRPQHINPGFVEYFKEINETWFLDAAFINSY